MEVPPGRHVLGGIARALRFEPGLEAPRVVRAVQVAVRLLDLGARSNECCRDVRNTSLEMFVLTYSLFRN